MPSSASSEVIDRLYSDLKMNMLTNLEKLDNEALMTKIKILLVNCFYKIDDYDQRAKFLYYLDSKATRYQQIHNIESDLIIYEELIKEDKKNRILSNELFRMIFERQIKLDGTLKKLFSDVDEIEELLIEKRRNIRSLINEGGCGTRILNLNMFNMQMQVRKLELLENKTDLMMNRYRSASKHIKKRIKSQFEIIDNINKLCFSSPNFVLY
jgi:hypothetical protein